MSIQTLRRWEAAGTLLPTLKTKGRTRYYDLDTLLGIQNVENDLSIAYACVSGHDQKKDLENQAALLASFCMAHGWNYEVIQDQGSGMNYH